MKNYIYYLLILFLLFTNNVCGQTIFIKELAEAKKLPPSAKKDSIIVDFLFRLTQIHSVNVEKWQDSLKLFGNLNKNRTAFLLSSFLNKDITTNQFELLTIADEFKKNKYYAYASWVYLRTGVAFTYYFREKTEQKKALIYYDKALSLAKISGSEIDIVRAYDYLGDHYLEIGDYKKGLYYFKIAEKLAITKKTQSILPTIYSSLASCYINFKESELANKYFNLYSTLLRSPIFDFHLSYKFYINYVYLSNASKYYFKNKEFKKSLNYGLNGLYAVDEIIKLLGQRVDFTTYKLNSLEIIHKAYFGLRDFENAYKYYQKYEQIKNSKNKNAQIKDFKELNLKYQTDQNKLKITALTNESLKKEVEKQTTLRYSLMVLACLLLLLIAFIYYSNIRLRKKNKDISEAMLKGQTTERQRVAADLHDNLGSTLASIQWSLQAIDKSKMDNTELEVHQNLSKMLEKAYNDVRFLAHNLLPEEFEKQGLVSSLKYFVRKLNQNSVIKFELDIDENLGRFDKKIEFELYSICLELVTNILKHSKATEAKIELSHNAEQLKLIVADNGIGTFKNDSDGKGMKNVKARVESINGTWKVFENGGIVNEIEVSL